MSKGIADILYKTNVFFERRHARMFELEYPMINRDLDTTILII